MGKRWRQEGGYREVLHLAIPLILSTGSWSIQEFTDRVFLSWYSRDAVAAALPAGLLNFALASVFIGTVSYVNTFVAQYSGAGRSHRVGPAVWQGMYLGLVAGLVILGVGMFSKQIFDLVGHDSQVRAMEVEYFRILCYMGPAITGIAAASFFTGRKKTGTVLCVNLFATGLNVLLDYAWIFGHWGFPAWGIRGAAWATVVSHLAMSAIFVLLMFRRKEREAFATLSGWRPDLDLFRRMMRFGMPNGVQFALEMTSFSLFVLMVGQLGAVALAATNITFNINTLAFVPMLGMGLAVSTLVGQYLGRDRADLAERSTWSAFHIVLVYMGVMALGYVGFPKLFLMPYASGADPETFAQVWGLSTVLLRFVAFYILFDAMYIVFSAAVKGAGDTRFVMVASLLMSWSLMVIPTYVGVLVLGKGLYAAWMSLSVYILVAGTCFMLRFRGGKWKKMRVIEAAEVPASGIQGEGE
ncbi:MAG: MATE family efflux transporter [bacterium]|nr:MATE family efflux transporter [bacterium]